MKRLNIYLRLTALAALLTVVLTTVAQPTVKGSVYGGCNTEGTISGNTVVTVTAGKVGTDSKRGNIHGGGYGQETRVAGDVTVNIGKKTEMKTTNAEGEEQASVAYQGSADIYGDVYGGSALGDVNTDATNWTRVNLYAGNIHGDAYGGGLGQVEREAKEAEGTEGEDGYQPAIEALASVKAMVNGNVYVTLEGAALEIKTSADDEGNKIPESGRIFGCNNQNGSPQGSVTVEVKATKGYDGHNRTDKSMLEEADDSKHTYEVEAVYGGGNLAAYEPYGPGGATDEESKKNTKYLANVIINGCDAVSIRQVYGGGNAASTPATKVDMEGCYEVEEVFGGGNGKDRIQKHENWNANPGANVGFYEYTDNEEGKTDTKDNRAKNYGYGTGEANVNINGGLIHRVFGGSNTKGNVRITAVTMLEDSELCETFNIDEAYGGGKSASMDAEAKLLMACIPGLSAAYGGAEAADVQGGVSLTITNGTFDRVFGGNNISGTIQGPIVVNIEETGCKPIVIGELYGGGNEAGYSVYGYEDGEPKQPESDSETPLYDDPQVNIKSFTSIGDVFGGGYGEGATMVGNPHLNINVAEGKHKDKVIDEDQTTATVRNPEAEGGRYPIPSHAKNAIGAINNVFGGGNAAMVIGDTYVNIGTARTINYVSVEDKEATTDVDESEARVIGADIRQNVYGGGNQAAVTGSTHVTIGKETVTTPSADTTEPEP